MSAQIKNGVMALMGAYLIAGGAANNQEEDAAEARWKEWLRANYESMPEDGNLFSLIDDLLASLSQPAPQGVAETISMPMTEFVEAVTGVLELANKMCEALEQERDALKARVAEQTDTIKALTDGCEKYGLTETTSVVRHIAALEARVAELEGDVARDAARYRHIRDNIRDFHAVIFSGATPLMYRGKQLPNADQIDAGVDTAIASTKEKS